MAKLPHVLFPCSAAQQKIGAGNYRPQWYHLTPLGCLIRVQIWARILSLESHRSEAGQKRGGGGKSCPGCQSHLLICCRLPRSSLMAQLLPENSLKDCINWPKDVLDCFSAHPSIWASRCKLCCRHVGVGGGRLPGAWSFRAQVDGELRLPHRDLDTMFVGTKLVRLVILSNDSGLRAPLKLIGRNMV